MVDSVAPQCYIEEIDIQEFRGIRGLKNPIKLSKYNIIIGRNNVGKTALLEALYLLPSPYDSIRGQPLIGRHRMPLVINLHGGDWTSLIYGYSGYAKLSYKLSTNVTLEFSLPYKPEYLRVDGEEAGIDLYIDSISKCFNIKEEDVSRLTFLIPNDTLFIKDLHGRLLEVWDAIVKEGLHREIVSRLVNPVVYDKFTEILIERNQLKLRNEVGGDIGPLYITLTDLGDGVEKVTTVGLALEYFKPRVVLWDDLEVAMHPGLVRSILRWLTSRDWQVVISTHSIDVLNIFTDLGLKDGKIILLRKTSDDFIEVSSYTPMEMGDIIEKGIDIRKIIDILEL